MENVGILQALGLSLLGMLVVFAMLVMLMLVIMLMGKLMKTTSAQKTPVPASPAPAVAPAAAPAPRAKGSCGPVDLHDVDDRTAALLMAIVADKLGAPLCELRFKSIRKVK